jgi:predicted nucleic acid-binding protein
MRRLLGGEGVSVSRLSEVELVSAMARLTREGAMAESTRDAAVGSFLKDLAGWEVVELTVEVSARARGVLIEHRLKASDAVQLASALVLQSRIAEPMDAFVTLDARLLEAARRESLAVWTS